MKIHVFDEDKLSKRVLDRTGPTLDAKSAENDPKLAPQNDTKSIKNQCQKMINFLFKKRADHHSANRLLGRPGGMRWPPGGIIGGAKNTLFEIFERLGIL